VSELQQHLRDLGYTDSKGKPLAVDGDFGRDTRNAVEAFQHDHNLTIDGKAGPKTLPAVQKEFEQRGSPPIVDEFDRLGKASLDEYNELVKKSQDLNHGSPDSPNKASPLMDPDLQAIYNSNGNPEAMKQSAQNYRNSPSGQLFEKQGQAAAAQQQDAPEQQAAQAPRVQQERPSMSI